MDSLGPTAMNVRTFLCVVVLSQLHASTNAVIWCFSKWRRMYNILDF